VRALRVMLVEDDYLTRLVAGDFLRDEGFEVEEASSGDEAALRLGGQNCSMCCSPTSKCRGKWMDGITLQPTPAASIRRLSSSSCPASHRSSTTASRISTPPRSSCPNPIRCPRSSKRSDASRRNIHTPRFEKALVRHG
jgi:CheY-like chemotaxis protein